MVEGKGRVAKACHIEGKKNRRKENSGMKEGQKDNEV